MRITRATLEQTQLCNPQTATDTHLVKQQRRLSGTFGSGSCSPPAHGDVETIDQANVLIQELQCTGACHINLLF